VGNSLRQEEGASAWTKRLIERIKKENPEHALIDSIRNPAEIIELKKHFKDFTLISIDAPQRIRFQRAVKRNKNSDPKDWEGFLKVDLRDLQEKDPLGQQVGECMKLADFKITNDSTLEEFERKFHKVLDVLGLGI
jgi:dephospho-CoA kinase